MSAEQQCTGGAAIDQAATDNRDLYILAPLPPHGPTAADCPGCYARCETPETHWWGCTCPPHGPGAARLVTQQLAAAVGHAHLVTDGETVCIRGGCPTHPVLDGVRPDPAPTLPLAEVLL